MGTKDFIQHLKDGKQPVITVFGDYCLDEYLYIDARLHEVSAETGLTAFQVTHRKLFAGAAGTITNNLQELGAKVLCIGLLGEDGDGSELEKCLQRVGADTRLMLHTSQRNTCKYTKPMLCQNGMQTELNRLDIKNFTKTPLTLQEKLIENLAKAVLLSDAVIICDQFEEEDFAAVTEHARDALGELAEKYSRVIFFADSRGHIDKFRNCIIKCNQKELAKVYGMNPEALDVDEVLEYAAQFYQKNGKPVYVTLGECGSILFDGCPHKIPAFRVEGPIDIVGAGDAFNAGAVFALTTGAGGADAALVGNAAASIVIKQIGMTGTAKLPDIIKILENL